MKFRCMVFFTFIISLFSIVCFAQTPRDVNLTASDGMVLRGSFFDAKKLGPGIILLHQCNRERHSWSELALRLSEKGFHVLTLDYRGFGESDGTFHNSLPPQERQVLMKEKWRGDIDAALQYLISQPGVDKNRIGAGGASCGVNQAVQLARRNPAVKSLVLLSGSTDTDGITYIRESSWLPIFAAAADDDRGAVETLRWITGFSKDARNKFLHYVSGGHGADLFPYQRNLIPAIIEWFDSTLKSAPEKIPTSASQSPPTPQEEFWSVLHEPGGAARALEMFQKARKKDPNAFAFPEGDVNALGYEKLQAGNTAEAIDIFRLNVAAHPNSANVYDSLSDAYLAAGQTDQAREFAQKAIDTLEHDQETPEAFKTQLRQSAMQKLKPAEQGQNSPTPSRNDIVKLPIVLKTSGTDDVIVRKDIVYKSVDGIDLKMDVYLPKDVSSPKKAPIVLFISGGGNDEPSPKDWGVYQSYGRLMAAHGMAGVEFNKRFQRSPDSLPAAESDVLDLIAYLRKNADSLNVDPERIGVAAFSAGGRLLAPFLRKTVPGVKCLASIYGVMTAEDGPSEYSAFSQIGKSGQTLPLFIVRAGQDSPGLNAGIDASVREAIAKGFEVEMINHAAGHHGFDIVDDNDRSREIIQAFVTFLKQNLL